MFNSLEKFIIVFIIIFSGCRKGLQINNNCFEAQNCLKFEAKFYDIPIPLAITPISKDITETSYSFYVNSKVSDLISFYNSELENFGWKKMVQFCSFETLLIFFKPNNKYVSICIRPEAAVKSDKIKVVILLTV